MSNIFTTQDLQHKVNFMNRFNKLFPEMYSAIESDTIEIIRSTGGIDIYEKVNGDVEYIAQINLRWVEMGKLRIDGNMTGAQSRDIFRLLSSVGIAS